MRFKVNLLVGLSMLLLWSSCKVFMSNEVGEDFVKIGFDTREMTQPNVDVSPDGKTIVFDVLGDLYTVPINGGTAKLLIGGDSPWNVKAKYSPDGSKIAFLSDRDGSIDLWTALADGSGLQKQKSSRNGSPVWSSIHPFWDNKGRLLDYDREKGVWATLKEGETVKSASQITSEDNAFIYQNGVMVRGENSIFYSNAKGSIIKLNLATGKAHTIEILNKENYFLKLPFGLKVDITGRYLAFISSEEFTRETSLRNYVSLYVLDTQSGAVKKIVDSVLANNISVSSYALTPDGTAVIVGMDGKLTRIDIDTGERTILPVTVPVRKTIRKPLRPKTERIRDTGSVKAKIIRWLSYNRGNSQLVYNALGQVYSTNVEKKKTIQLTQGNALSYSPALSPDGQWIAYTECDDFGYGHIMLMPSGGGTPRQITKTKEKYTNLTWSPGGNRLAFYVDSSLIAAQGLEKKGVFRESWSPTLMQLSVFDKNAVPQKIMDVRPIIIEAERYYPPITFSADGNRVFLSTFAREMDVKVDLVTGKEAIVFSVNLDGSGIMPLMYAPHVDEFVISPDNKRVAMAKGDRILIADLPQDGPLKSWEDLNPYVLTEMMGDHAYWVDANTLLWANTNKIYMKSIEHPEQEATLLVDIDVQEPVAVPKGTYALMHARILTMRDDEIIEDGTVLVKNNRIIKVGKSNKVSIPKDVEIFDLRGKTIIPGLIDTHSHSLFGGIELWQRQNRERVNNLAWGVTTIYDPSPNEQQSFGYAEMIKTGKSLGPRLYSSSAPITNWVGENRFRDIYSLKEADRILKERKKYEPGPIKEYLQIQRVQRQWLRSAAKKNGLGITTHPGGSLAISDLYNTLTRVVDGYTGLEHEILIGTVYNDVISFIAKSKVYYTPTLIAIHAAYNDQRQYIKSNKQQFYPKIKRFNPEILLASYMGTTYKLKGFNDYMDVSAEMLAKMVAKGAKVSTGGHGVYIPGLCTHFELWTFGLGSMPKYEILRAATLNGAEKLGLEKDLGSIEPGKLADMVVLNGNPLEDIHNTADIQYVISNGYIYEGSTMTRIWPDRKELKPWPWEERMEVDQELWDF